MILRTLFFLLLTTIFPMGAFAQKPPYDLRQLLTIADRQNPDVVAAMAAVEEARGRLREAREYPNPELRIAREEVGLEDGHEGMSTIAIGQPVILGKRRAAATRAAEESLTVQEMALQSTRQRVAREVHRLWARMIYLDSSSTVNFRLYEDSSTTVTDSDRQGLELDVLRSEVDNLRDELQITTDMAERVYAAQDLDLLLGGVNLRPDQVNGSLEKRIVPAAMAAVVDDVVEDHPEVQMYRAMLRGNAQQSRQSVAELTPDVTVGILGGYSHSRDEAIGGVSLQIPIPIWDRNRGKRHELVGAGERIEARLVDAELRIRTGWEKTLQMVNEYHTLVSEYEAQILPRADKALKLATEQYQKEQLRFLDYIDVQRQHHQVHRRHLQYLLYLNESYAELRWLRGEIDENNIQPR